jgi:PAT family beta-lactamase induction signal transducer AmpG
MFAGRLVGQAIGGSGVLFLIGYIGFQSSFVFVAPLHPRGHGVHRAADEGSDGRPPARRDAACAPGARHAEMKAFAVQSFRSFLGTQRRVLRRVLRPAAGRRDVAGPGAAIEPGVELGMNDDEVAVLSLWSMVISAGCMVVGGLWSDKWGRRRTLFVYLAGMSPPVVYLMWVLLAHGYVMPRAPGGAPIPELVTALWIASLWYSVFQGLMYGTRSAIFMDVTNPVVAATQFTAYMAMMNLAIAIAAGWQGVAVEAWGYPVTLAVDAVTGLLCLLLLPAMKRETTFNDALASGRARKSALVLGLCCLAWLPYWANHEVLGKGQPIMGTFFTLVFIASALFLLAGREVLGDGGRPLAPRGAVGVSPAAADVRALLDREAGRRCRPCDRRRSAAVPGAAAGRRSCCWPGVARLAAGHGRPRPA